MQWLGCWRSRRGVLLALALVVLGSVWLASSASGYVYWSTGNFDTIGRANLDGTGVNDSFIKDVTDPQGLALGPNGEYIYWAIAGAPHAFAGPYGSIGRATLDGEDVSNGFIKPVIEYAGPYIWKAYEVDGGVAADSAHVYWSELSDLPRQQGGYTNGADLARANLDGTAIQDGYGATGPDPTAMAVDSNYIYWVNANNGTIGRSTNLAAGVNQNFITGATDATGLALGASGTYIYWSASNGTIGRANYNGSGVDADFIKGADKPRAVAVNASYIYWINANGTIGRADVNGTGVNQSFITGATNAGNGLVVNDGPPGVASASPSSVSYGTQALQSTSPATSLGITNTGHGALVVSQAQLTGGDPGEFKIAEDTCLGATVQPGAACELFVQFAPSVLGVRTATLTLTSVDQTGPLEVPLSGEGGGVTVLGQSLTGLPADTPRLRFSLATTIGAPRLKTIAISAPAGLSFADPQANVERIKVFAQGVSVATFTANVSANDKTLTIKLATPAKRVRLAIASPELRATKHLSGLAARGTRLLLLFPVAATDAMNNTTQLQLGVILGKRPKLLR